MAIVSCKLQRRRCLIGGAKRPADAMRCNSMRERIQHLWNRMDPGRNQSGNARIELIHTHTQTNTRQTGLELLRRWKWMDSIRNQMGRILDRQRKCLSEFQLDVRKVIEGKLSSCFAVSDHGTQQKSSLLFPSAFPIRSKY